MSPGTGRALFPQIPAVTSQMRPRLRRNGGSVTNEPSPATAEGGGDLHQNSSNQGNSTSENQNCTSPAEEDELKASNLSRTG